MHTEYKSSKQTIENFTFSSFQAISLEKSSCNIFHFKIYALFFQYLFKCYMRKFYDTLQNSNVIFHIIFQQTNPISLHVLPDSYVSNIAVFCVIKLKKYFKTVKLWDKNFVICVFFCEKSCNIWLFERRSEFFRFKLSNILEVIASIKKWNILPFRTKVNR